MLTRPYGKDKEPLSIIGFGGIIVMNEEQSQANRFVAEAIDQGINYFDVAPSYGNAEEKLGPAITGKRNGIFLACKTEKRTGKEAAESIERSLRLLKTDRFDLFQLHGVTTMEDVDTAMGSNGAIHAIEKARKEGKIRHIGFSAHSEEAALALFDQYPFESVLFPFNWAAMIKNGFGRRVIAKAAEKGASCLALKAMARRPWPEGLPADGRSHAKCWYEPLTDERLQDLALRFTLSQPVTAAIPPGHMDLFRRAVEIAEKFTPVTDEEIASLASSDRGQEPIFQK